MSFNLLSRSTAMCWSWCWNVFFGTRKPDKSILLPSCPLLSLRGILQKSAVERWWWSAKNRCRNVEDSRCLIDEKPRFTGLPCLFTVGTSRVFPKRRTTRADWVIRDRPLTCALYGNYRTFIECVKIAVTGYSLFQRICARYDGNVEIAFFPMIYDRVGSYKRNYTLLGGKSWWFWQLAPQNDRIIAQVTF